MKLIDNIGLSHLIGKLKALIALKADKTYVDNKVKTDVPVGAKFTDTVYTHPASHPASMIVESTTKRFVSDSEKSIWNSKPDTDTITTINGKTGAITKADIVALGIPAQDTNTTYSEITTAEIDAGTASTLRTITARTVKYILDKVQIPTGLISMWSGSLTTVPEGWALCNGENGTPDLTDRFIVGAGNNYAVGDVGGEDLVTLVDSDLPYHRHSSGTLDNSSSGGHSHTASSASTGSHSHGSGTLGTSEDGEHSHSASSGSAGSHSHTQGTLEIGSVDTHTHGSGTYSTSSASAHTHGYGTYSTSTGGSHSHSSGTLATASAGNHQHTQRYRSIHITGASGDTTRYLVGNTLLTNNTTADGSHTHSVSGSTASGGSHSHSVSGTSGSGGSHSHSVSGTSSSGGSHTHDISGRTSSTGSHSHSVSVGSAADHSHSVSGSTSSSGSHSHTITVDDVLDHTHSISGYTGYIGSSSNAHENRPPYYALAYIMKL